MSKLLVGLLFVFVLMQAGPVSAAFSESRHDHHNERRCLAEAIYHEARGESLRGKIAVGNVVMNRLQSGAYANTICGVVYQRSANNRHCQFSWACRRNVRITHDPSWQESLRLAEEIMNGLHRDNTRGAIAFNNAPFRNMRLTVKIGNHYFYTHRQPLNRLVEVAEYRGN